MWKTQKNQIIKNGEEGTGQMAWSAGFSPGLLALGEQGRRKPFDGSKFNLPASSPIESKPLIQQCPAKKTKAGLQMKKALVTTVPSHPSLLTNTPFYSKSYSTQVSNSSSPHPDLATSSLYFSV